MIVAQPLVEMLLPVGEPTVMLELIEVTELQNPAAVKSSELFTAATPLYEPVAPGAPTGPLSTPDVESPEFETWFEAPPGANDGVVLSTGVSTFVGLSLVQPVGAAVPGPITQGPLAPLLPTTLFARLVTAFALPEPGPVGGAVTNVNVTCGVVTVPTPLLLLDPLGAETRPHESPATVHAPPTGLVPPEMYTPTYAVVAGRLPLE